MTALVLAVCAVACPLLMGAMMLSTRGGRLLRKVRGPRSRDEAGKGT